MTRTEPLLIVGAGIAGLALARRLVLRGAHADVVERQMPGEAQGAGILLTGNAVRALRALGLERAVLDAGRPVRRIRYTDAAGAVLFEVDCVARAAWPPFVSIERSALQELLLASLGARQPRWGIALSGAAARADNIEVTLSDGSRSAFRALVGADGVRSSTRRLLFGSPAPEPVAGFHGWRFLAPCPRGLDAPHYMLGNGRTLLLHPLADGKLYCGAGPVAGPVAEGASELERLRRAFTGFGGFAPEVLESVSAQTQLIATRYWHVEQASWHRGRVVLVGDAAHACAPTLAQGAAMALEDALVLSEALHEHESPAQAFAAYQARRAVRVARVQAHSLRRLEAMRPLSPKALRTRDAVLRAIGAAQLLDAWAPLMERSP